MNTSWHYLVHLMLCFLVNVVLVLDIFVVVVQMRTHLELKVTNINANFDVTAVLGWLVKCQNRFLTSLAVAYKFLRWLNVRVVWLR